MGEYRLDYLVRRGHQFYFRRGPQESVGGCEGKPWRFISRSCFFEKTHLHVCSAITSFNHELARTDHVPHLYWQLASYLLPTAAYQPQSPSTLYNRRPVRYLHGSNLVRHNRGIVVPLYAIRRRGCIRLKDQCHSNLV